MKLVKTLLYLIYEQCFLNRFALCDIWKCCFMIWLQANWIGNVRLKADVISWLESVQKPIKKYIATQRS